MSLPAIFTSPAVGRSSPPRIWSSVVLPEPDAPMIARRSPARTLRFTPCSTCRSIGPWRNARSTPLASMTSSLVSFMAKGLRRQRTRRAPRGVDSRERRQCERHARHLQYVAEANLGRQITHEVDTRIQELYAEKTLDSANDRGD